MTSAPPPLGVDPTKLFSPESSSHDVLILIKRYLLACGLQSTATTLRNECEHFKKTSRQARRQILDSVLEGDWETLRDVAKLGGPVQPKQIRTFLYLVNRQEFFELVNNHENYQAFAHLVRKLKPLERECKIFGNDFRDLSYLATCRSVTDSPQFRSWEGVALSRQRLARELERMVLKTERLVGGLGDGVGNGNGGGGAGVGWGLEEDEETSLMDFMEEDEEEDEDQGGEEAEQQQQQPDRLVSLLQQAYAYQIECKRRKKMVAGTTTAAAAAPPPTALPYRVSSLLVDFSFPNLPVSAHCQVLSGHTASVKCLEFVPKTSLVVSGGGDSQVLLWDLDQASASGSGTTTGPKAVGLGHSARVWDVSANHDGSRAASVSADSSLRIWDLTMDCGVSSVKIDTQHENDIYSVRFHPNSRNHVLTCGHDQTTKLVDVETSQVVKVFRGHTGSVVHAVFNPVGNLIATGSKDSAIKFFDAVSGVCVKTLPPQLGEVASVQFSQSGDKVLTATKDSTHRLWDVRHGGGGGGGGNNNNAAVPAVKFKGHVNSSKSFIRAQFGSTDNTVLSGSENGVVYVWDAVTGEVLERLLGHQGSVFRANWSRELDCMASCAEDGAVRIWKSNAL